MQLSGDKKKIKECVELSASQFLRLPGSGLISADLHR
jgi:hypothetical protein